MSAITHVAHLVEEDHAVVFCKTADGETHAFEFGRHATKAAAKPVAHDHHGHDHHSQMHTQHAEDVKHQQHGDTAQDHATYTPNHYTVHVYSPFTNADHGKVGVPKKDFVPVKAGNEFTPESLAAKLKSEWYQEHVGCFVFHDASSFDTHVLALLTE